MAKKRVLGAKIVLGMLIGLLATPRPLLAATQTAPAHIRAHTWTLTASAFRPDPNGHLSPVERAPFDFTAAAVHLKPAGIAAFFLTVELRLRAEGGAWSPWYPVDEFEPQADGRLYGENLVAWPQAREIQVRVGSPGSPAEAIQELAVVAIDARDGPTTVQAVLSSGMAAGEQTALAQDDPGVPQPAVIRRADWGADEAWMTWPPEYAPVDKMVVHHTVSGGGGDPAAEVRAVYYYHAVTRGWGDIGYNFVVDKFGHVYEGRYGGPDVVGAHVAYWNEGSMGVSVLGCYDNGACSAPQWPTEATLNALADLIAWAASRRGIDPRALQEYGNGYSSVTNYALAGHRDYGTTACPGGNLYAELPDLRQTAWERLPEYDVRFGSYGVPASLDAGQQVTVYLDLYNYGRLVWSDAGGVRLGYRWLQDGQVVAEHTTAARIIPGAVVGFGEMTALVGELTAPAASGTFTLRWDLYRDGVGWFNDQPAPAGRSQTLDLAVEVKPVLALDVQLEPPAVAAGALLNVNVALEGLVGQAFEARTRLPPEVQYVAGSGQGDPGDLYLESGEVVWVGTFGATSPRASFALVAPPEQSTPLAISTLTTLNVAGFAPLVLERWFIVNGYSAYLPLVERGRAE